MSDGTAAGTSLVKDLYPGRLHGIGSWIIALGSRVYFQGRNATTGFELFTSDGTAAGTKLVEDIWAGPRDGLGSGVGRPVALGGKIYFRAFDLTVGTELFMSDGTAAGTKVVKDIRPGSVGSLPLYLTVAAGALWFQADDGTAGKEPWRSDGTAAGTKLVKDVSVNCGSCQTIPFAQAGSLVVFEAFDPLHGIELWRTDGTAAGTRFVKDITPGRAYTKFSAFGAAGSGGRVVFGAGTWAAATGPEPWVSDGTASGTRKLTELHASAGSVPTDITTVGSRVFFRADDGLHGNEVFTVPLKSLGANLAESYGAGCVGAAGAPALAASGLPTIGNASFAVGLARARASSVAVALVGSLRASVPLAGGCRLLVGGPVLALAAPTDAQGRARWSAGIPQNAALLGTELFAQALVVDAQGAFAGLSFANAVQLVIGA